MMREETGASYGIYRRIWAICLGTNIVAFPAAAIPGNLLFLRIVSMHYDSHHDSHVKPFYMKLFYKGLGQINFHWPCHSDSRSLVTALAGTTLGQPES